MQSINLTVQAIGKPDINALTDLERKTFLEQLLKRITELSKSSRSK